MVLESSSGSMSSLSRDLVGISDAASCFLARRRAGEEDDDDDAAGDRDLELGLSLGGFPPPPPWGEFLRTAKEFPPSPAPAASHPSPSSVSSSSPDAAAGAGADHPSAQSVVGWPPVRAFRMNSLFRLSNDASGGFDTSSQKSIGDGDGEEGFAGDEDRERKRQSSPYARFVKVNVDGDPIGRKVDIAAHSSYESLAVALEAMFSSSNGSLGPSLGGAKGFKLLDGSPELALTYEDKEGDWMLVGDVPWRMFLSSVKRLRIMKTTFDAVIGNGRPYA